MIDLSRDYIIEHHQLEFGSEFCWTDWGICLCWVCQAVIHLVLLIMTHI